MTRVLAFACAVLVALLTRSALAANDSPSDERAEALYRTAEAEDAAGDYARAVEHYRAAVAEAPSFRYAPRAMTRATLLAAHAEGDYAPYRRLESVRRDPAANSDAAAIDALAKDAASFPPGPTRGEAWMVCADAYLHRLDRRADGEAALARLIDDPKADVLLRRQAASALVGSLVDDGDLSRASDTARSIAPWLDAKVVKGVTLAIRRRALRRASIADLAIFALLASLALARAAKRGALVEVARALRSGTGLTIVFASYVALAGGALASAYETGNSEPFLLFGAALAPLVVLARAWGAAGSPATAARAARVIVCASAVLATAFLVLQSVNVQYLEGFRL